MADDSKSHAEVNEEAATSEGFVRQLGLLDSTMLVAGSMIGSGVFIVSADIGRLVGSAGWLLVVWAITGILTVVAALSYGELAAMLPRAGGHTCTCARPTGLLGVPLWLDVISCHPDWHDRRRSGGVCAFPWGGHSIHLTHTMGDPADHLVPELRDKSFHAAGCRHLGHRPVDDFEYVRPAPREDHSKCVHVRKDSVTTGADRPWFVCRPQCCCAERKLRSSVGARQCRPG